MAASADTLTGELAEFVAIPSISADPARASEVRDAGSWVCELVRRAGGEASLLDWHGQPLAVGELSASHGAGEAPTVLVYGHFDVQPADPLDLWSSDPFTLTERDGWLYGRGVVDDKGQLYMLLKAAELLAAEGRLPVNVRVVCDGEEETGGDSVVRYLAQDERGADAAVVFDSGMLQPGVPAFDVAVRGLVYFHLTVTTGDRDLHSGVFGGAALNAIHALLRTLAGVLPEDGSLPPELTIGTTAPTEEELADWADTLPDGAGELRGQGARPADAHAAHDFYLRTWASPAVDVNGVAGGSPHLQKTVLPVEAHANVSIRLAPGQDVVAIAGAFERLLVLAAPAGAHISVSLLSSSPPGLVQPDSRAVQLGLDAFATVLGRRPVLVRSGGTIPIVPALSSRGIPAIVTGFALPDSNIHAPDERLLAEYLPLGVEVARELFLRLAELGPA